jgi:hypothetical protein
MACLQRAACPVSYAARGASLPECLENRWGKKQQVDVFGGSRGHGDNGTPRQVVQAPYHRSQAKGSLYQGGINVPMVIAGAGVSRTGQREGALVNSTDLFATFADIAGVKTKVPVDSVSFVEALTRPSFHGRSHAYMDFRENGTIKTAIRDRRYKLLEQDGGPRQLFDLKNDPYETQDLLATAGPITLEIRAIVDALISQRNILQK